MCKTENDIAKIVPNYQSDSIFIPETESTSASIPKVYYDFKNYVTKQRMLTFYHQISEVLYCNPRNVLEIGVGSKVVSGTLREIGIPFSTMDINAELQPDYTGSVVELESALSGAQYDLILCARVLHHLSFSEFETAISQMAKCCDRFVVLTLPVEDLRIHFSARITSGNFKTATIPLPLFLKQCFLNLYQIGESRYQRLWKINSHPETKLHEVRSIVSKYFTITKQYKAPEDQSHMFFVLTKLQD